MHARMYVHLLTCKRSCNNEGISVCTVFNEHKACLLRLGERGFAIQEAIRQQCGNEVQPDASGCM